MTPALDLDVVDVDGGEAAELRTMPSATTIGSGFARPARGARRASAAGGGASTRGAVRGSCRPSRSGPVGGLGVSAGIERQLLRSPKIPCGRKIISSISAEAHQMNRIRLTWVLSMMPSGMNGSARRWPASKSGQEADQEPEDHRAERPGPSTRAAPPRISTV